VAAAAAVAVVAVVAVEVVAHRLAEAVVIIAVEVAVMEVPVRAEARLHRQRTAVIRRRAPKACSTEMSVLCRVRFVIVNALVHVSAMIFVVV
jgi:hypothetical protein